MHPVRWWFRTDTAFQPNDGAYRMPNGGMAPGFWGPNQQGVNPTGSGLGGAPPMVALVARRKLEAFPWRIPGLWRHTLNVQDGGSE